MNQFINKILATLCFLLLSSLSISAQHLYTQGVVVLRQETDLTKPIIIYDEKGNVCKKFVFSDDFDKKPAVRPLVSWAEYLTLVFNCLSQEGQYFKVVIDERKKQIGYILKSDKKFRYESWPEHITSLPTVEFDAKSNPLRDKPNEEATFTKALGGVEFYHPKQVVGDWLKVIWDDPRKGFGWIKWKDKKNNLLIQLFYVM